MHGHERLRARADGCCGRRRVHPVVGLRDVDRNGEATRLGYRFEGCHKGHCRHEDLGALLQAETDQREPQRIEPARDPDAVSRAAVRGERLLERRHLRAVRECARAEEALHVLEHVGRDARVDGAEVEERDAGMCVDGCDEAHRTDDAHPPPTESARSSDHYDRAGMRRRLLLGENNSVPADTRVRAECTSLRRAGWDVTVVGPRGRDRDVEHYRELDGVRIHRCDLVPGTSAAEYVREATMPSPDRKFAPLVDQPATSWRQNVLSW